MGKTIAGIYFSPTGNTKKSVEAMLHAVSENPEEIDLTVSAPAETREFTKDDFVIFGVPVYVGRVPTAAKGRFAFAKGNDTPCLLVATYGNRDFDDALVEMEDMFKAQGFVVKGAAALVGRHTYGAIQTTRPDADDLAADADFARKAFAKAADAPAVVIPGGRPYRDGGTGGKFHPLTTEKCVKCGLCVRQCPVQAIDKDCRTISDVCLSCFRCIRNCPVGAKNMDDPGYNGFAAMFTERLKERRENEFFL